MNQRIPVSSSRWRAAFAAPAALLAIGLSFAGTASAANCSDAPVSGVKYYVVNKDSGLQLDVYQASSADGASVVQWWNTGGTNQQWTLTQLNTGIWTMVAAHSNSALDLYGWNTSEDAPVKQWSYGGNQNQQWKIAQSGDAWTIVSNASNKLLMVADTNGGTTLKVHSELGSGRQRWYFNRVDGKCGSGASTQTSAFGSFMGHTKIMIGGGLDKDTRLAAPFDVGYEYIHSQPAPYAACYDKCTDGCSTQDRGWWGCWGTSSWDLTSGAEITNHYKYEKDNFSNSQGTGLLWDWTWYSAAQLREAQCAMAKQYSGATKCDDPRDARGGINNKQLLQAYLDDYRFFLKKIGDRKAIVHLEPDFWGYVRVQDGDHPNDPHYIPAQVQSANSTDCGSEENTAAGLTSCLFKMARKYAPNSTVGLHLTCWDWYEDDTATRGPKACLKYYKGLGADKGDLLLTDVTDMDAGYAMQWGGGQSYVWDDAKWKKFVAFLKLMTEGVAKPVELWQVPLGNVNMNNTPGHWKDDKVLNVFNRINDLAAAHVVAVQFGCGQTTTTCVGKDGDGGYMLNLAKDYYAKGGVSMK